METKVLLLKQKAVFQSEKYNNPARILLYFTSLFICHIFVGYKNSLNRDRGVTRYENHIRISETQEGVNSSFDPRQVLQKIGNLRIFAQ